MEEEGDVRERKVPKKKVVAPKTKYVENSTIKQAVFSCLLMCAGAFFVAVLGVLVLLWIVFYK